MLSASEQERPPALHSRQVSRRWRVTGVWHSAAKPSSFAAIQALCLELTALGLTAALWKDREDFEILEFVCDYEALQGFGLPSFVSQCYCGFVGSWAQTSLVLVKPRSRAPESVN